MKTALVKCESCGFVFERRVKHINEGQKEGWRVFCSLVCQRGVKRSGKYVECFKPDCGKVVYRTPSDLRKSLKIFCSPSCAASVNNKIRKRILKKRCANPQCDKLIPNRNAYCSNNCQGVVSKKNVGDYRKEVVEKVREFVRAHERLPVKGEMMAIYMKARKGFGTWNNAIIAAGFDPNPVMFAKKYTANDGHKCDSLAEKIIDDWLSARSVKHSVHVLYPGNKHLRSDFVVGDYWIEFFGLANEHRRYDELKKKKLKMAKDLQLRLIAVYPQDLFPRLTLDEKLGFLSRSVPVDGR